MDKTLKHLKILSGVALGVVGGSFIEWAFHKHVLHGLGIKKNSIWNSHWYEHHKSARKHEMKDEFYDKSWPEQMKTYEFVFLSTACLSLITFLKITQPQLFVAATITTLVLYGITYYVVHSKSHTDPEWAEKWLKYHVDHHMGKDQNKNWCVVFPLADHILNTRIYTEKKIKT